MLTRWDGSILLFLIAALLAGASPAGAQEPEDAALAAATSPSTDSDAARRATVLAVLERPQVQQAARLAGVDLTRVATNVHRLEGEPLARAARQAEALDRRLAIDGVISSTTLILLLILTILIIVIIQD